jgi:glyoxylase-like metal-dependent hydrolase (beta-lactamase superfamily II)
MRQLQLLLLTFVLVFGGTADAAPTTAPAASLKNERLAARFGDRGLVAIDWQGARIAFPAEDFSVTIGGRAFEVLTAGGHSPEHVMLYSAEDNLLLAGDQILAKISPNVSVEAMEPDGDPLGVYLRSLEAMKARLPEDVLVLPGHNLPFVGLHTRADELIAHHEARCMAIVEACTPAPQTAAELVPVIFGRPIDDPHQLVFAFGEALAHINTMIRAGRLRVGSGERGLTLEAA